MNAPLDPNKRKDEQENTDTQNEAMSEGVYAYNADGTPMDTGERTYISADLPEEEDSDKQNEEE